MSGDRFESLIADGVDRIALPPESEWLPDPSRAAPRQLRPSRLVFLPLVAAVIVLAAVLGAGLRTVREQSPASQPPATSVPLAACGSDQLSGTYENNGVASGSYGVSFRLAVATGSCEAPANPPVRFLDATGTLVLSATPPASNGPLQTLRASAVGKDAGFLQIQWSGHGIEPGYRCATMGPPIASVAVDLGRPAGIPANVGNVLVLDVPSAQRLSFCVDPPERVSASIVGSRQLSVATPFTASPAPTLAPTDQYGLVVTDSQGEQRITVRRERGPAPVFELKGVAPVVSVDGKRLAYWRSAPNSGGLINGTDLRVVEVADPTSDRSVFTSPADMFGGLLAWSNDGQGLLVVIDSRARIVGGPESCSVQSELLMLDLAAAVPSTRSAGTAACRTLVPLAWDRPGQAAAAIVTGPGGYATEYMTWSGNAASPFAKVNVPTDTGAPGVRTQLLAFSVWASADARLVMGLESSRNVLRVWPLLDITKADLVRSALPVSTAAWRPGTGATGPYEVIWALGQRVELFRYKTDSVETLYSSPLSLGIAAVRPDGSGVLIEEFTPGLPPPPTPRLLVVDVATKLATDLGTNVGGLRALTRGVLLR